MKDSCWFVFYDPTPVFPDEIELNPKDLRWVGAWWLGFLVASCLLFLAALPYMFFPRKMPKEVSWEFQRKTLFIRLMGLIYHIKAQRLRTAVSMWLTESQKNVSVQFCMNSQIFKTQTCCLDDIFNLKSEWKRAGFILKGTRSCESLWVYEFKGSFSKRQHDDSRFLSRRLMISWGQTGDSETDFKLSLIVLREEKQQTCRKPLTLFPYYSDFICVQIHKVLKCFY